MRTKTIRFSIISILVIVQLVANSSFISPIKFANADEQYTILNKPNVTVGTNNTVYLGSSEISKSLKEELVQNSSNSIYTNTINLSMNEGHSEAPEIVTHGRYVYVLWLDDTSGNRDIYFKRSADNGNTFDHTVNLSNNPGGSINPHMAISENSSSLYIVWEHIPGNNGEIFFTRSTDNGATFQKPINIGTNTGLNGSPQIVASANNVYVVWHHATNGIQLTRSTDNGHTFDSAVRISGKNAYALNPQLAASLDNVYVVWQSNPLDKNASILYSRSTDNGHTFGSQISISEADHIDIKHERLSFNPQILTAPGTSNVYVVWHSGFTVRERTYHVMLDVFFTKSTDNGATFERPISLSNYSVWSKDTDNGHRFESLATLRYYSGWSLEPQIATSQDNIYVSWQSNPHDANGLILFCRSTDNGHRFESPISISDKNGDAVNPQIATSDGNVYEVWQNNIPEGKSEVVFSRSTDNGHTFESPISISDKNGDAVAPRIAVSKDNNLYSVWNSDVTGNEEIMLMKVNAYNDIFSFKYANKNKPIQNALQNNSAINMQQKNLKNIAFIDRTFSDAAYNDAFYLFYHLYDKTHSNITKYTNLLTSKVLKIPLDPEREMIVDRIKWLRPETNITILTDEDAHNRSSLFMDDGTNKYDVILFGHNEYNTQQEYNNLREFVANGGIMIFLGANMLFAEVKYDEKSQAITLVKGHGFEFKGESAQPGVHERWANETTNWVGSVFCDCWQYDIKYGNNPFGYIHNEEQSITNPKAKIILDYNATENGANPKDLNTMLGYNATEKAANPKDLKIATYEINYKKGKVITFGLMTTNDLFNNEKFNRFFDSLLLYYVFREYN
jgi:hypothetical protein